MFDIVEKIGELPMQTLAEQILEYDFSKNIYIVEVEKFTSKSITICNTCLIYDLELDSQRIIELGTLELIERDNIYLIRYHKDNFVSEMISESLIKERDRFQFVDQCIKKYILSHFKF